MSLPGSSWTCHKINRIRGYMADRVFCLLPSGHHVPWLHCVGKHCRICCSERLPSNRHWVCFCPLLQYYGAITLYTWTFILIWRISWSMRLGARRKIKCTLNWPPEKNSCSASTQSLLANLIFFDHGSQRSLIKGCAMKCKPLQANRT